MSDILGVKVDNLTKSELNAKILVFLNENRQHTIVTPNPEMIMKARKEPDFRERLNRADVAIPDGTGLIFASAVLETEQIENRITGVEALEMLARVAHEQNKSMFLLGGERPDVAKHTAGKFRAKYPGLKVHAHEGGPIFFQNGEWHMNPQILDDVKSREPDILAVALGHGKQEHWIESFLPELPSVSIAIGIGGAFDYLSGAVTRAPKFMQKLGLEWLFRLIREPWRVRRIFKAVFRFPLTVIWVKIKSK